MKDLNVTLNVGYNVLGEYTKDVQLLRSNAITEEIATRKLSEKPYTWIAYVLSVFCAKIGKAEIAEGVRKTYLDTGDVVIPDVIKKIPLADANTLLLEIHRRSWQNLIPKQKIICRTCSKSLIADVDLDKIRLSAEQQKVADSITEVHGLTVDLTAPLIFDDYIKSITKLNPEDRTLDVYKGVSYNTLQFNVVTLGDCIRNEAHVGRNVEFWRYVALSCLAGVQETDSTKDDSFISEFPMHYIKGMGLKFFHLFDGVDLKKIRTCLIEELPTMPFGYEDECPCDLKKTIPYVMEATNFFSE